jgi:hypothetical protein
MIGVAIKGRCYRRTTAAPTSTLHLPPESVDMAAGRFEARRCVGQIAG